MSALRRMRLQILFRFATEEARKAAQTNSQQGTYKWLKGLRDGNRDVIEDLIEKRLGRELEPNLIPEEVITAAKACKPMLALGLNQSDLELGIDGWRAALPIFEEGLEDYEEQRCPELPCPILKRLQEATT